MDDQEFLSCLEKANNRLKKLQTGIQIERRGERLNLRGVLPPRPTSEFTKRKQQRIPLGLPASKDGIEEAERESLLVAQSLKDKSFSWNKYNPTVKSVEKGSVTFNRRCKGFKSYILTKRNWEGKPLSSSTWNSNYRIYLTRLENTLNHNPSLTLVDGIYETINTYDEHSRSREICCRVFSNLADFLNLDIPRPIDSMRGKYKKSQTNIRIPSDQEILAYWEKIPSPEWRLVYGMIATYGMRNYEPFFSERPDKDGVIYVEDPSTMYFREVYPFIPIWVETFSLRLCEFPSVSTDMKSTTLQSIGQRVTRQFKRYNIPFSPSGLRSAWIARLIKKKLPESIIAKLVGTSNFNAARFIKGNMELRHEM